LIIKKQSSAICVFFGLMPLINMLLITRDTQPHLGIYLISTNSHNARRIRQAMYCWRQW